MRYMKNKGIPIWIIFEIQHNRPNNIYGGVDINSSSSNHFYFTMGSMGIVHLVEFFISLPDALLVIEDANLILNSLSEMPFSELMNKVQ